MNPEDDVAMHDELTIQQAAELLGVSVSFLVKQLDNGLMPFHEAGTHRRVLLSDLMTYKRSMTASRTAALEELTSQGQDLDMGY